MFAGRDLEVKSGGAPETGLCGRPSRARLCAALFWEFAKITAVVLGGGYVIMSVAENEFVRKRRWISQQDFLELMALSQTVPGVIACNGAVCIGLRIAGLPGAVSALIGTVLPPVAAILLVASGMAMLPSGSPLIEGAFLGVDSCVVGVIAATAWRFAGKTMTGRFEIAVAAAVVTGRAVFGINPGWLMVASIPCGVAYVALRRLRARRGGGVA